MLRRHFLRVVCITLGLAFGSVAWAETIIPQSALTPSMTYYTDLIGGGIGAPVIMTGGGLSFPNPGFSRNDDGFSGPIPLGFTVNFFGTNYTEFWANNNGSISFGNGVATFIPEGPVGATQPVISPFFADVDTRNTASGVMSLRTDIPNQIIVTWDMVGYFEQKADLLNSFQLVLRGPGYAIPAGEGAVGFFYKSMQWETGDFEGSGGFGGTPAAVGFGDGEGDGVMLQGSLANGISGVVNNHYIWFDLGDDGIPRPTTRIPEPYSLLLLGGGLMALAGYLRLKSRI